MDHYQKTFQTWDKLASAYQEKFMDMDLYNDSYDLFCELITKKNARIFEIGCGPGNITKYILNKRPDLKIEAIDVSPSMLELAKINNPSAVFKVMDVRTINTLTTKFDAVLCGFCLPYLSKEDAIQLIKNTAALLDASGVFYFSTIEDNYTKSGYETSSNGEHTMYVYYHEAGYLQQALQENNFETINIIRKNYNKSDGTISTHIIFIVQKK